MYDFYAAIGEAVFGGLVLLAALWLLPKIEWGRLFRLGQRSPESAASPNQTDALQEPKVLYDEAGCTLAMSQSVAPLLNLLPQRRRLALARDPFSVSYLLVWSRAVLLHHPSAMLPHPDEAPLAVCGGFGELAGSDFANAFFDTLTSLSGEPDEVAGERCARKALSKLALHDAEDWTSSKFVDGLDRALGAIGGTAISERDTRFLHREFLEHVARLRDRP